MNISISFTEFMDAQDDAAIMPTITCTATVYAVEIYGCTLMNSAGGAVSYPIKGRYRYGKKGKWVNSIWTLDGVEIIDEESVNDLTNNATLRRFVRYAIERTVAAAKGE